MTGRRWPRARTSSRPTRLIFARSTVAPTTAPTPPARSRAGRKPSPAAERRASPGRLLKPLRRRALVVADQGGARGERAVELAACVGGRQEPLQESEPAPEHRLDDLCWRRSLGG